MTWFHQRPLLSHYIWEFEYGLFILFVFFVSLYLGWLSKVFIEHNQATKQTGAISLLLGLPKGCSCYWVYWPVPALFVANTPFWSITQQKAPTAQSEQHSLSPEFTVCTQSKENRWQGQIQKTGQLPQTSFSPMLSQKAVNWSCAMCSPCWVWLEINAISLLSNSKKQSRRKVEEWDYGVIDLIGIIWLNCESLNRIPLVTTTV